MGWLRLFKGELVREAQQWVEQGLVQRDQAERILERFDTSLEDRRHWSLGYVVLVGLAILSLGLALFLLVSHNWDEWPRAARMAGLILVTLGLNVQGMRCYAQGRVDRGMRWLFAGAFSYGASIMLIAQIYHLGEHFPDGLYWWALGVLPMALLTQSRLLHGMQWLLATFWFMSEARYGLGWSYPLFLLALGWQLARHTRSRLLVFALLWGGFLWLHGLYAALAGEVRVLHFDDGHLWVDTGLALLGYALVQVKAGSTDVWWRDTAQIINLWFLRLALLVLFVFSFVGVWDNLLDDMAGADGLAKGWLLACDLVVFWLMRQMSLPRRVTVGIAMLVAHLLLVGAWIAGADGSALMFAVIVNMILLASAIRLLVRGLELHAAYLFYTGVVVILIQALLRYLDVMGDYLSGAMLFVAAAAVLFAAARFWQRRMQEKQA